jgi:hypothetical protein
MPLRDCYIVSVDLMVWTVASDVVFIKSTTEGVRCSDAKVSGECNAFLDGRCASRLGILSDAPTLA